jgi:anti-sigma regulatory factor (Ser/Thr protein kinase)
MGEQEPLRCEAAFKFPAAPQSAGAARRFIRDQIDEWRVRVDEDEVVLMVSELVTNVGLHARTDATVRVTYSGGILRVSVSDGSTEPVEVRPRSARAETGRGLMIVEALAEAWGVETGSDGKTVWFEVRGSAVSDDDDAGRSGPHAPSHA